MPDTHFAAGQRQKASSSKSKNKSVASASNYRPPTQKQLSSAVPQKFYAASMGVQLTVPEP